MWRNWPSRLQCPLVNPRLSTTDPLLTCGGIGHAGCSVRLSIQDWPQQAKTTRQDQLLTCGGIGQASWSSCDSVATEVADKGPISRAADWSCLALQDITGKIGHVWQSWLPDWSHIGHLCVSSISLLGLASIICQIGPLWKSWQSWQSWLSRLSHIDKVCPV